MFELTVQSRKNYQEITIGVEDEATAFNELWAFMRMRFNLLKIRKK